EVASYHGRFVDFDRIWVQPKPAQRPHPPILVGGNGPGAPDRALAFGDAWFPEYHDDVPGRAAELTARADRPIGLVTVGVPADPRVLERLRDAGFSRAMHWLPSATRSVIERQLDLWESAIADAAGTT
ncbi:MAG TPA: LLM class flavin-dependent oxidoreductase, partial [Baekduia sp.]